MRSHFVRLAVALLCFSAFSSPSAAQAQRTPGEVEGDGLTVSSIHFRNNKQAEDEAIRLNLSTQPGDKLSSDKLRDDIRAIWKMGYFEDVQVEMEEVGTKVALTFVVREKPTIRKIYIAGNREVGLDKINEVLDLKKDTIIDLAKVKRNVEKVREVYVDKGFYLADVTYEIKRKDQSHVDVYFICDEHAKVEVRQIRFLGNKAVPDSELKSAMGTSEGGWLSFITSSGTYREDAFERDLLLLQAFYFDKGYINVKLGKPVLELSGDKMYLYITIPIDEGQPFHIGKIDFKGELLKSRDQMFKIMQVKNGDSFSRTRLGQDIQKLNDIYKDAGYAYVNIQPLTAIDGDKRIVYITFDVQKGNLVYFGKIKVMGNTKTRDKVIRRELRVYEGDLYNQTQLDRSKRLVHALGFFERVELSSKAQEGNPDKMDVTIEVTERATGTFQIGAGFSSVENFIGQAQVAQNNLFGHGTSLQLQAQISSLRQLFSIRYVDPYFLDTKLTFAFSAYNSLLFYPSFNRTSRGGDLTWGYLFGDHVRVFGTYKLENVQVKQNQAGVNLGGFGAAAQLAPGTVSNLFRSGWTSSIKLALNYDSRNDRQFPTKGMFHSLSLEVADPVIASESVFLRAAGFLRFYQPIWGPFIFRTNIEAGYIFSRSSQGVPIYERYFLGGVNTIRGFNLFALGPRVNVPQSLDPNSPLTQFNIGGNLQLILNMEIEFPIFAAVQIKGVIFFDAGNAYNTETARYCTSPASVSNILEVSNPCTPYPTFTNLRYAVGFGFRWVSPIGPLRFEWGIPLNRQAGEDPIVFQFTIGNFF